MEGDRESSLFEMPRGERMPQLMAKDREDDQEDIFKVVGKHEARALKGGP